MAVAVYIVKLELFTNVSFSFQDTIGFPVPYIGFLSMQGSFYPMLSPILTPNYKREIITPFVKLPTSSASGRKRIDVYQDMDHWPWMKQVRSLFLNLLSGKNSKSGSSII